MALINQAVAMRRFHQGLYYLLGTMDQGHEKAEPERVLAVGTLMAYLGAYAFPGENLHSLKEKMRAALAPLGDSADIEVIVERAVQLAEVFRRPWSEPGTPGEPTI